MLALGNVGKTLGLPSNGASLSPFNLMARIEGGLPISALERLCNYLAPNDTQFKYRFIPKATFERRKRGSLRLSPEEGMRVARVARVWTLALEVWQSEKEAREFLFRPHPMLEDGLPIDVAIKNEIGAELVIDILGSLKYGSAA